MIKNKLHKYGYRLLINLVNARRHLIPLALLFFKSQELIAQVDSIKTAENKKNMNHSGSLKVLISASM